MVNARELIEKLRFDCMHYLGDRPCVPHVQSGHRCTCVHFRKVTRRGVIIKLGAAGDVLRTTPLLRTLQPRLSGTKILWVTHSPELIPLEACEPVQPTAATLARIRAADWDFCWNLDKDPEACAIAAITNATERRGYTLKDGVPHPIDEAAWHKFATGIDDPYSRANRQSYVKEIYEIVGIPYRREEYWLREPSAEARTEARRLLGTDNAVGLNLGAGKRWPSRIWPLEYWAELIDLIKANALVPVLLGGPEEAEMASALAHETGCIASGVQPLGLFYALIERCRCVVTAVTMAMHLAIGARTPLVLINNIFNPHEFELYGRGEILQPKVPCDCYYSATCRTGRRCIAEIAPRTVLDAVVRCIRPNNGMRQA